MLTWVLPLLRFAYAAVLYVCSIDAAVVPLVAKDPGLSHLHCRRQKKSRKSNFDRFDFGFFLLTGVQLTLANYAAARLTLA